MKILRIGNRHFVRFIGLAVLLHLWAGCSTAPAPRPGPGIRHLPPVSNDMSWRYARFRMHWPAEADPAWHTDLLLAHQVVKPVLDELGGEVPLWRFHRRAVRDEAGHQFSFIYYASSETARRVAARLAGSPVLEQARSSGRVVALLFDGPPAAVRPNVADASDPAWSAPLRQAWPHYLMGASRMWLDLIGGILADLPADGAAGPFGFAALDLRYAAAGEAMAALWRNEGRHAFLHHLNALFGYEPILVQENQYLRF